MIVTHLGPQLARTGGPAGYLLQLATAFADASPDGLELRLPPVAPLLLECIMSVVFFPLIALPSAWLHRRVVGPMRGGD